MVVEPNRESRQVQEPSSCEVRTCAQCGNSVTDPLVTRCPRCWAALPGMACGACKSCPMGKR